MKFLDATGVSHLWDKIKTLAGTKVSKTGDTMTGSLTAANVSSANYNLEDVGAALGQRARFLSVGGDLNDVTAAGLYCVNNATANAPQAYGYLIVIPNNANYLVQLFIPNNYSRIYMRHKFNGTWDSWLMQNIIMPSTTIAIPSGGSSASYTMAGITANHKVILWNFGNSSENSPPTDLTITTYDGYFTVTNNGATVSDSIRPAFALLTQIEQFSTRS